MKLPGRQETTMNHATSYPVVVRRHGRNRRQPRRARFTLHAHQPLPRTLIVTVTADGGDGWMHTIVADGPAELRQQLHHDVDVLVAHLERGG
jgi:hypothetical protein